MPERDLEEEYFHERDREKILELKKKWEGEAAAKALQERRELHYHRCGKCGASMETKPFRGIEIEVCVECGSVLLDPGELELLAGEDKSGVMNGLLSFFSK